ncbi:MAG: 3-isopropylmalate dehydratase large subunit [Euryarchaeota archaeon]|nr:3-isopropylmalate dehydratase large subunit [Euryarchaeota archaeon]
MPKGMTIAEAILARAGGKARVEPGEIVDAKVDRAMSHDNGALVAKHFAEIGVEKVWDKDRIVLLMDHRVPANDIKTAEGHKKIREFVAKQGIPNFFDIKEGICHQVFPEHGYALPGQLIVGTDSHTTTYGAVGAMSTGIGATEMAGVWATGSLWLMVPKSFKFNVKGKFPKGAYPKDLILKIIGDLKADGADYASCEFYGPAIDAMTVGGRMTICNMSMEMGAKSAICPPDKKVFDYLKGRAKGKYEPVYAAKDAAYEKTFDYDVSALEPMVAAPHTVDNVKPLKDVAGTKINQAIIGSCTNGRLEDLKEGAAILKGKTIYKDVRLIVAPASREVLLAAMKDGTMDIYVRAGAVVINPGCGPCLGAHEGIMAAGERCISSTNRNFKGRMGDPASEVYLASPAAVAASALEGAIADPRGYLK